MGNDTVEKITLRDCYLADSGTVFLTGVQALVRFLIEKHRRDKRTQEVIRRTFVSGYEGSPLGGLDLEIRRNLDLLNEDSHCVHQPAVNEKIAAASVTGSQYNGDVDGFWYGKAHGTKWAADELSLANLSGSGTDSGVVLFCGDDHGAKSSGYPAGSETVLRDAKTPVFYPSSIPEVISYAHHALALSRYSGLACALKLVTPICDGAATLPVSPAEPCITLPDYMVNGNPYRKTFHPVVIATGSLPYEEEVADIRLGIARSYAQLNGIDQIVNPESNCPLGIIATGISYPDVRLALDAMGLGDEIRLLKLGLVYPLNHEIVQTFGHGLESVLVVEEKGPFVEEPVAQALFNTCVRRVYGKRGPDGNRLIPAHGELNPDRLVESIEPLLKPYFPNKKISQRVEELKQLYSRNTAMFPRRAAHYCPGCPHSISVTAPSGETAGGEIGCSSIDAYVKADGRGVRYIPTMGMGGALNNGMFPFNGNDHMFQNVGDGTVLHSGLLTIFSSISHGANVTYKILWNHVVAMTGGQDITGQPGLDEFIIILLGLGVKEVSVVSKCPERVPLDRARASLGAGQRLSLWERDELERVQLALKEKTGVSVLIFDQECATEVRRKRKREGIAAKEYVFINDDVCEGCGDCGQQSMCLALYPKETEYGVKTAILQSSCNQDASCLKGDCPSFIAVEVEEGVGLRRPPTLLITEPDLAEPDAKAPINGTYAIHIIGIGGTGVVTIAHILGFAANFDGKQVNELNRTGLAQKGGPVESPVILGDPDMPLSNMIPAGRCDLYLAADIIGGVNPLNLAVAREDRTVAVVSSSNIPTAEMVYNPAQPLADESDMEATINRVTREAVYVDAQGYAEALFGDHIFGNIFLLGVAYQAGSIPLSARSIEKSIVLNGQAVELNLQAFRWGRMAILDRERLDAMAQPETPSSNEIISDRHERLEKSGKSYGACYQNAMNLIDIEHEEFRRMWAIRVADLIAFQNTAYATKYVEQIARVYESDRQNGGADHRFRLTHWAAFVLFKFMAYKDEYEISRLLIGEKEQEIREAFDGKVRLTYNLQPPLLREWGLNNKMRLGPWFRPFLNVLAWMKVIRNTAFDPFRRTRPRKRDREQLQWYETLIDNGLNILTPDSYPDVVELLRLPEQVRGYEEVKYRSFIHVKYQTEQMIKHIQETQQNAAETLSR
ncbi:MAG: indolepyruvate ferredoxin oxidoreductase family protein [Gemmatimonadota bacterium]|nr:indolepyruvate ferredoxin oxidoreductase family protein [Gemmatimonadota bacterium]